MCQSGIFWCNIFWSPSLWTTNWQSLQRTKEEVLVFKVYFLFLASSSSFFPSLFLLSTSVLFPTCTSLLPLPLPISFSLSLSLSGSDVMLREPGSINLSWMSNRFHFEYQLWRISHDCLENGAVKNSKAQSRLSRRVSGDQLTLSVKGMCHMYLPILL